MKTSLWSATLLVFTAVFFSGCTPALPHRTTLVDAGKGECATADAWKRTVCATVSPESSAGSYDLHFVEYDDQGWAYPTYASDGKGGRKPTEVSQTDHLMTRLGELLGKEGRYINVILYVHGWKHDSDNDDGDVTRFRQILTSAVQLEARQNHPRQVVGIYVGWRGKSWNLPGYLLNGSFWARKSAAERVSQGSVQELFSRLRTVQRYYNGVKSLDCSEPRPGVLTTGGCRFRILMIGHSFGAYILYSAIKGPLIATLNAERDLSDSEGLIPASVAAEKIANVRPADMIVLINPAFEAVRYQPVHRAAINYHSKTVQPPLLVSITSTADMATKNAFPAGRFLNSIFERPTSSDEQSEAMAHTHGHTDIYLTHELTSLTVEPCLGWTPPGPLSTTDLAVIRKNKAIEEKNSSTFFHNYMQQPSGRLGNGWIRSFCGGTMLTQLNEDGRNQNRDPNSLVWNIHTDKSIISSHTDIIDAKFLEFVRQLYDDSDLRWQTNGMEKD